MNRKSLIILNVFCLFLYACSIGQKAENVLDPVTFQSKIKADSNAVVLDVRTPGEFNNGHLKNAMNADWRSDDFYDRISVLEKDRTVMVYCMGGGRSASAAKKMQEMGFTNVFDLKGGIMNWRSENLPEVKAKKSSGMSTAQFEALINKPTLVLVDYYADWCLPCQKMKPYLEEISKEMKEQVEVLRIDADQNQDLCKNRKVNALPVLELFKNQKLVWKNQGYIEKDKVVDQIKAHL